MFYMISGHAVRDCMFLVQSSVGMQYLHDRGIVHFDLRSSRGKLCHHLRVDSTWHSVWGLIGVDYTARVFRMTCICRIASIAVPDLHDEFSSGRPVWRSPGISVSEAALLFGNLGTVHTKPALFRRSLLHLRKKPSDSWKKPSELWRSCTANACWKSVPNLGNSFKDTYCILLQ